jgi:hypothetical protein
LRGPRIIRASVAGTFVAAFAAEHVTARNRVGICARGAAAAAVFKTGKMVRDSAGAVAQPGQVAVDGFLTAVKQ